jgi:hypothetical protein
MLDADYARHFKVLGKYVKGYDDAAADAVAQSALIATTADQVATGLAVDNGPLLSFAANIAQWMAAISSGADAIRALMITLVADYMRTSAFLDSFETAIVNAGMPNAQLAAALDEEMTEDSKLFDTASTTGFAHFFNTEFGTTMPASGSPTHADATYVVSTVV